MLEQPNPTRMELLKIKNRVALAKKGHALLKQKRDALILEFFKILKKAKDIRSELNLKMKSAYNALVLAKAHHSSFELEVVSLANAKKIDVEVEVKNVMGVKIPNLTINMEKQEFQNKEYSALTTSAVIEQCLEEYTHVLKMALQLAETEGAIKKLIIEIEKTKRRVNSLEFIVIPQLEEQLKTIMFKLDELERDCFVSLKIIKRKMEKEKNA